MPKKSTTSSAKKIKSSLPEKNGWQKARFKILNEEGIHTRPAAAFVRTAQKYPARIRVGNGKEKVDGKSILNLLSLGIKKGVLITIAARGPGAKEALRALGQLIKDKFGHRT